MQKSANYLDLFAKRYSEKAKTIKFTLFFELTLSFHPSLMLILKSKHRKFFCFLDV